MPKNSIAKPCMYVYVYMGVFASVHIVDTKKKFHKIKVGI